MAKKYITGNSRAIPAGSPIKSRRVDEGSEPDVDFYEGDTWYPGPATTEKMIIGWLADGSLIEADEDG